MLEKKWGGKCGTDGRVHVRDRDVRVWVKDVGTEIRGMELCIQITEQS